MKRHSSKLGTLILTGFLAAMLPRGASRSALPDNPTGQTDSSRAKVTAVYDGDTVRVRLESGEESRVRLIGVDSPEIGDDRESVRMMAFLAKRFSYLKLYGKTVVLTFGSELRDSYGRLLAFVGVDGEGTFNEILIREGYAFAYLKFPFDDLLMNRHKKAEVEAREAGRGLWRRDPWPLVGPEEAGRCEGRIVSVRFLCFRSFDRGRFRILDSGSPGFQAVIPLELLAVFPGSLSFENHTLLVTGIVERYRGKPQIMIGVPLQIKDLDRQQGKGGFDRIPGMHYIGHSMN